MPAQLDMKTDVTVPYVFHIYASLPQGFSEHLQDWQFLWKPEFGEFLQICEPWHLVKFEDEWALASGSKQFSGSFPILIIIYGFCQPEMLRGGHVNNVGMGCLQTISTICSKCWCQCVYLDECNLAVVKSPWKIFCKLPFIVSQIPMVRSPCWWWWWWCRWWCRWWCKWWCRCRCRWCKKCQKMSKNVKKCQKSSFLMV